MKTVLLRFSIQGDCGNAEQRVGRYLSLVGSATLGVLSVALLLAGTDARSDEQRRALKPIIEKGDTWTYRSVRTESAFQKIVELETITVTNVDEATDSIFTTVDRRAVGIPENPDPELQSVWTLEWNVKIYAGSGFSKGTIFRPHTGALRFPLKVGDTYNYTSDSFTAGKEGPGPIFTIQRTARAIGWEEVTVPAGTYLTIFIQASGTVVRKDTGQLWPTVLNYWYSPEVRRFVKSDAELPNNVRVQYELISFKLRDN